MGWFPPTEIGTAKGCFTKVDSKLACSYFFTNSNVFTAQASKCLSQFETKRGLVDFLRVKKRAEN
jgi:hypothetical protein